MRLREYYGNEVMWPVYIEVEDGERLERALAREKTRRCRSTRRCADVFWQTRMISEENILKAGIWKRLRIIIWMNV